MRSLILGTIFCILLAAGGTPVMKSAGLYMDWAAPLVAMAAGIVALNLAALPLSLVRGSSYLVIAQGGLASTIVHMLVMVATAAVVILWKLPVGSSFVFWLMGMYVITIVALVAAVTATLRTAVPTSRTTPSGSQA